MAPNAVFRAADANTGVAANELLSTPSPHVDWQVKVPSLATTDELPRYVPTALHVPATHSSLDDEDATFLGACRHRLGEQLRDND